MKHPFLLGLWRNAFRGHFRPSNRQVRTVRPVVNCGGQSCRRKAMGHLNATTVFAWRFYSLYTAPFVYLISTATAILMYF